MMKFFLSLRYSWMLVLACLLSMGSLMAQSRMDPPPIGPGDPDPFLFQSQASPGDSVDVGFLNMASASGIYVNDNAVGYRAVSASLTRFQVPTDAASGMVYAIDNQGDTLYLGYLRIYERFDIQPSTGGAGDSVYVMGSGLDSAQAVTLAGQPAGFRHMADTLLRFAVPSGARSGVVKVFFPSGAASPDSTFFTIAGAADTCTTQPTLSITSAALCGPGFIEFMVDSSNGCPVEVTIQDNGDRRGVPRLMAAADSVYKIFVTESSSILVRTVCNDTCSSDYATITVTVTNSPFGITVVPDSGAPGDTIRLEGASLDSVEFVRLNGQGLAFQHMGDTLITFVVPAGAQTGVITVLDSNGVFCSDTVAFRALPAACVTTAPTVSTANLNRCGDGLVSFTVQSANGCGIVWTYIPTGKDDAVEGTSADSLVELLVQTPGFFEVRSRCDSTCLSDSTIVRVRISTPHFDIALSDDSASVGDTVIISGIDLNTGETITFNGATITPVRRDNAEIAFVVPAGAQSGNVIVMDDDLEFCPDTAFLTIPPLPCNTAAPTVSTASITRCGPGFVEFSASSGTACSIVWEFRQPNEDRAGAPIGAGTIQADSAFRLFVSQRGTIRVRSFCDSSCISDEAIIDITIQNSIFNLALDSDTGAVGDTVMITGTSLDSVDAVTLAGVSVDFEHRGDTLLAFVVPAGAQSGMIYVSDTAGLCPDSVSFVIRGTAGPTCTAPLVLPIGIQSCAGSGPVSAIVTQYSGCVLEWFLASVGTTGLPLSTDSLFTIDLLASDTLLVRSRCDTSCASEFTRIPVSIDSSSFSISFGQDTVMAGDTIIVRGQGLSIEGGIEVGGVTAPYLFGSDTLVRFVVPSLAPGTYMAVYAAAGCPDSAQITIVEAPFACTPPVVSDSSIQRCGAGPVTVSIASSNGCPLEWFLASTGTSGAPLSTDSIFTVTVSASDTILVRTSCDTCITAFARIPVSVDSSTFNITLSPDSGTTGDTIRIVGVGLDSVATVTISGLVVDFVHESDSVVSFVVPGPVLSGPVMVTHIGGLTCPDSANFTYVREPVVCVAPTVNVPSISLCGPGFAEVKLVSSNGCRLEWTLASEPDTARPLGSDSTFRTFITTSDTILVRSVCDTVCTTSYTAIPVTILTSPYAIALSMDTASVGDTVMISGTGLGSVSGVTLSGQDLDMISGSDTTISFVVPPGAITGMVMVSDSTGATCSDSARLVIAPRGGNCDSLPSILLSTTSVCGQGSVTATVVASNGCLVQWFLASSGTSGAPLGTGPSFSTFVTAADTILARTVCDTACMSGFATAPVRVLTSAFGISLVPDSAEVGDTIAIRGGFLSQANRFTVAGVEVTPIAFSDSVVTIVVPAITSSGMVIVTDSLGSTCSDSAFLNLVVPVNCDVPSIDSLSLTAECGSTGVFARVDAASLGTCQVEWFLASLGTSGGPLATTPTFTMMLTASDTLLVRKVCDSTCTTAFNAVFVNVNTSPFGIALSPDTANIGDTVTIRGQQLGQIGQLIVSGVNMGFATFGDSAITFVILPGMESGYVTVRDSINAFCPDSAFLTIIGPPADTCSPAPVPLNAAISRCGTGTVSAAIASAANTCQVQWFLASSGTSGAPIGTGTSIDVNITASDTLLVRTFCDSTCVSAFARIPVSITTTSFGIRIDSSTAPFYPTLCQGSTVTLLGSGLNGVNQVMIDTVNISVLSQTDSSITFIVPLQATGVLVPLVVSGPGSCPDTLLVTPTICPAVKPGLAANAFSLAPNPARDHILITTSTPVSRAPLAFYDAKGRRVFEQEIALPGGKAEVRLPALPSGLYLVRLGSYTVRLAIE